VSLALAVPFGVASAIAYGAATAVQHQAAHTGTGEADPRGLLLLLRDSRWWLSIGGDTFGFMLQVVALSNGPVVLVQPLLVLTLPVSLLVGAMLGNARPQRGDYIACLAILAGLTVFFLLLGTPDNGRVPAPGALAATLVIALVVGALVCAMVRRTGPAVRAGVYGGVAGVWFGTLGVAINAVTTQFRDHGALGVLTAANGLVPLIGLLVLGGLGMTLTQVSFQVGALAASFPANKSADPVAAVVLGAVLLHQHVPSSPAHIVVYVGCLAAIVAGAVRLALPPGGSGTMAADEPPANHSSRAGQETR
jgi:drug/metabolite transporter (DMT)-like permease